MPAISDLAERREMVAICRKMNASGINQGTAGNLSLRIGDKFLITPSSLPYDTMTPEDIVEMAFDGTYVGRRPSSEWRFHRDILKHRTDIDVVLHCHSVYATTLAVHHKTIPSFHYMTGVAGGTTIRCAPGRRQQGRLTPQSRSGQQPAIRTVDLFASGLAPVHNSKRIPPNARQPTNHSRQAPR